MNEILGYALWEAAPGAPVEQHYKVAVFDDVDYAEDAADSLNRFPVIPGHTYYVLAIHTTADQKVIKAFKTLNIGGNGTGA